MRSPFAFGALALAILALTACSDQPNKEAEPVSTPAPAPTEATAPAAPAAPAPLKIASLDVGGITKVSREVEAVASTPELAVVAALESAVAQVNGVRVDSQMQSVRASLDVSSQGQALESVRAQAFLQELLTASKGTITGFEILSQEEISQVDEQVIAKVRASDGGYSYSASASSNASMNAQGSFNVNQQGSVSHNGGSGSGQASGSFNSSASSKQSSSHNEQAQVTANRGASAYDSDTHYTKMRSYWKVKLRVDVAKYEAPDEQGRPKIVVVFPKTQASSYTVGDGRVSSDEVANAIRGRLSDILTQTKRFIVLDRQYDSDMQAEIDKINSGDVRLQDSARLGQQLATDLLLIPSIDRFEYVRSVRQLRMSDRQLVSYSGGGRITLRLINASTGQVVMSDSFDHQLASADPSTLPRVINGANMAAQMMSSLSSQIGSSIVTEIFPISVVAMTGSQVVLSQGGEALEAGQHWEAVFLGEELKDPQTGRSLGHHETPIGAIRIDRVASQTSYGTLLNGPEALGGQPFRAGAISLRKKLSASAARAGGNAAQANAQTASTAPAQADTQSAQAESAPQPRRAAPPPAPRPAPAPAPQAAAPAPADNDDKW